MKNSKRNQKNDAAKQAKLAAGKPKLSKYALKQARIK